MKKVIILNHGLHISGVSRTLINFANSLVGHGYDVTIKLEIDDFTLSSELDPRVKCSLFLKEPHPFGLRIKGFLRFYKIWRNFIYKLSPKWQYRLVVRKKYDIEIGFNRGAAARIIAASTRKNSVKLAWVHNDYMRNSNPTAGFESVDEAARAYSKFDHVVCVSKQSERSFKEKFGDTNNLTTRFNIMDFEGIFRRAEEKDVPKTAFTVVSVGRLCEAKNYSLLMEAASILNDKFGNKDTIEWWIVGDGEYKDRLLTQKEEMQLENVKLLGAHSNPYPFFRAADMYLSTSIYEGLSTTTIEALILGKPVVVTDCVGMRDILGDSEFGMVVPINAQSVADAVYEVYSNENLRTNMSRLSKERSFRFSGETCFAEIEGVFTNY